jgi:hypothetical protein
MFNPFAVSPLFAEIIFATNSFELRPEFSARILGKTSKALAKRL